MSFRGMAPLILNPGNGWKWVFRFTPPATLCPKKEASSNSKQQAGWMFWFFCNFFTKIS